MLVVIVILALVAAMALAGALANVSPPQTSRAAPPPIAAASAAPGVAYSLTGRGPSGISISTRPPSITTG